MAEVEPLTADEAELKAAIEAVLSSPSRKKLVEPKTVPGTIDCQYQSLLVRFS
jgi:hypothetical protein